MTNLNPEICQRLRNARKEAKLSQIDVAKEIGCKQSALSMFEQGDGTKLNDEAVKKLAEKFGVDLSSVRSATKALVAASGSSMSGVRGVGFCPNPHCPSNHSYEVDGKKYFRPDRVAADPVGGRFCALCGEVLMKSCPNCGAAVHDGGICSICGDPYVTA